MIRQKSTHKSHTLTDKLLDENGVVDEYDEFHKIDFSNSFDDLESPDYEIRASKEDNNNNLKEDCMKGTRKERVASYVSQLTSGYDATVQDDYTAGDQNGQAGKAETEEVTTVDNWKNDKRDAIGRAASTLLRRTATRLNKMADMYESNDVDDLEDVDEDEFEEMASDESTEKSATNKEAVHPIEHDEKNDDPKADMDSQTGDDEWIDIGPGSFDDKRDEVGRAEKSAQ